MFKADFDFNKKKVNACYNLEKKEVQANFNLKITPPVSNLATKEELRKATETYNYEQAIASDTWIITHNLGKMPSITVVDSAGVVQMPNDIIINNENQITVQFISAFTGKAYLN